MALLGIAAVMSVVSSWVASLVNLALRPLHPVYFATVFIAIFIFGLIFLGVTWLIDRGLYALKIQRQRAGFPAR
jgi:hypothetical protein